MTREEIVRSFQYNMTNAFIEGWYEKNHERYTEEIEDVFYEGAEAAQKYLIDKACKWLENNFVYFVSGAKRGVHSNQFATVDEMVNKFRKALEE